MPFWTYMLHCSDRSFYVGHTDDLERCVGQHELGMITGYTSERLPVKLVWSQNLATRNEARQAEAQVKGWSRAKKLALIRGDWKTICALAKGKEEASTGLSRTTPQAASKGSAKPAFKAERFLHPHLSHLPTEPLCLEVTIRANAERLVLRYRLTGALDRIVVPPPATPTRQDGLWRRTCFEAFALTDGGPTYLEYNFSPSGEWAGYRFDDTRTGMVALAVDPPRFHCTRGRYALEVTVAVAMQWSPAPVRLGLCAVIEATDGTLSYWALAHPPGPPDFHHADGFALQLPGHSTP